MIAVVDLIAWAKENAWGRSATVPDGWIPSELMQNLVYEIKKVEPLHYNPQTNVLEKCRTCLYKDAWDEWEGNCDECENGSMYTPQTDERQELEAYRKCIKSRSFWDAKHCDGCMLYDDCPFNPREDEDEPQTDCPWK